MLPEPAACGQAWSVTGSRSVKRHTTFVFTKSAISLSLGDDSKIKTCRGRVRLAQPSRVDAGFMQALRRDH